MKRPNKEDYKLAYNVSLEKTIYREDKYLGDIEKYIDYIEAKFNNVAFCEHKNSKSVECEVFYCNDCEVLWID